MGGEFILRYSAGWSIHISHVSPVNTVNIKISASEVYSVCSVELLILGSRFSEQLTSLSFVIIYVTAIDGGHSLAVPLDGAKLASDQSAYMLMTIMVMGVRLRL
jgi:hypothetical protein